MKFPFNSPTRIGLEIENISDAVGRKKLSGDGYYTHLCHQWLRESTVTSAALLTQSCTAALEMAAILLDIKPGDEIIMPSYTFVSTANAFALRGGTIVFVDIRIDTMNIDENLIEAAITNRTVAIVPVHYAGVSCEMDKIMEIAEKYHLRVVEDAAQGIMASYKGRPLGGIGDLGTFSFHETKNVISGEGGALLIRDPELVSQAEVIREKGTDRSQFLRGELDKYTWRSIGSSYLPSEIIAAFLWAQLQEANNITSKRLQLWNEYHRLLEPLSTKGLIRRPTVPDNCMQNGHMYYVVLDSGQSRTRILERLRNSGIGAISHYVPLHSSPAGQLFGRVHGEMVNTDFIGENLFRLPLWIGLDPQDQKVIVEVLTDTL